MSAFTGIEPRISMGDDPSSIAYANALATKFIERFAPGEGPTHQAILQSIPDDDIEYAYIVTSPQQPQTWDEWKKDNLSLSSQDQEKQYLALILMYRDQLTIYGGLNAAKTELKGLGEKISKFIKDPPNGLTDIFLPRADDTGIIESGDIITAIKRDITTFEKKFPAGSVEFLTLATFFQSYSDGIQLIAQGEKSTTVTQITKVVNYLEKLTGMFDEFINSTINWAKKQAGFPAPKKYSDIRKSIWGTRSPADVDTDTIHESQVVIQVAKVGFGLLDDGMTFDKSEFTIDEQIAIIRLDVISVEIYNEFVANQFAARHFLKKLLKIKDKLPVFGAPIDLPERTRGIRKEIIKLFGIAEKTDDELDQNKILDNIIRLASNNNLSDYTPVKVKYIGTPQPKYLRDDSYWAKLSEQVMEDEKEWGRLHTEVAAEAIRQAQEENNVIAANVIAKRFESGLRLSERSAVVNPAIRAKQKEEQDKRLQYKQQVLSKNARNPDEGTLKRVAKAVSTTKEKRANIRKEARTKAVISDPDESISDPDDMDVETGGKRNTKKQKKNQKKKTMKAPHKRTIKKRKRRKNKTSKNRS